MSKDTISTLRNLKKDILAIELPSEFHHTTVRFVRSAVLDEINKTIKRKE